MAKRAIRILGPAVCDASHFLTLDQLKTNLNIDVIDSRTGINLIGQSDWERLKIEFDLPRKTKDGIDSHGLLSHVLEVYRDMVRQASGPREFAKVPLKAKRGQLGTIARPLKSPRRMPRPLYPEVESLLAGRLALYRLPTEDLPQLLEKIRTEVRQSEFVTIALWLAANEVRLMGALSRERIWVGGPNADTAGQLLISHLIHFWRFDLGREPRLTRYDSKKRAVVTYSDIVAFAHRLFLLHSHSNLSISAVYRRMEEVMPDLYLSECCNYGCGFSFMHKHLPTADEIEAFTLDPKTNFGCRISVPSMRLSRQE